MNKTKKQNVLLIISVILVLVLLAGMILATVLMSTSNLKEWTYYSENRRSDYITDLQTYSYVSAFSDALKNYVPLKKYAQYFGYNDFIDQLTVRIVTAMQDANVPAIRLKTIAD
ncbi:MAG: hypothetical protein J5781_01680, partial [Clostridia bacterium]|nr:hypothetical protein [Clostridia bacterium]